MKKETTTKKQMGRNLTITGTDFSGGTVYINIYDIIKFYEWHKFHLHTSLSYILGVFPIVSNCLQHDTPRKGISKTITHFSLKLGYLFTFFISCHQTYIFRQ